MKHATIAACIAVVLTVGCGTMPEDHWETLQMPVKVGNVFFVPTEIGPAR